MSSTSSSEITEMVDDPDVSYELQNLTTNMEVDDDGPGTSAMNKTNFITSRLVSALDRCKITDRFAIHIIAATAEALGHSVNDLIISRSTIQRIREANRAQISTEVKENLKV